MYEKVEYQKAEHAVEYIRMKTNHKPEIAIILGSGLGNYADTLTDSIKIPYSDVPNMPKTTVLGHQGAFVIGYKNGKCIIVMQGRIHYYEGYTLDQVIFPIRLFKVLGVHKIIITNAAGAVNTSFKHGEFMLITDHINLTGNNCLIGQSALGFGERFPSMSTVYDPSLRAIAERSAVETGVPLRKGIYYYCTGPSFETPAEIRAIRTLGGDAVGMSTVHEAVASVQMGMKVLGVSCLTNMAAGILDQPLTHEEVIQTGKQSAEIFSLFIDKIIEKIE